jgi:DNA-binding PadR family transcriptional regulator
MGRRGGGFGGGGRFGGGGGKRWGGAGHHDRGRGGMLTASELRTLLLSLIAAEPGYGYHLIRSIERQSGGEYAPSPGVIYPALTVLEELGLIAAGTGDGPRKIFTITATGKAELQSAMAEVAALKARLASLGTVDRAQDAPVRRAMENLKMVLGNATARLESGRAHDIAALIDAVAQQIERLD